MSRQMKAFTKPLIEMRMKPNRIYNNVLDHFGHTIGESPVLRQVQTIVGHFKRTTLNDTDFLDDMVKLAKKTKFMPDMPESEAFTFGFGTKEDGAPSIGQSLDGDPTIIGISTPYMIKMLRYAVDHVVHIDTTYKLDQSGYPVLVVGVSDQSRSFQPVAMFVTSQQTGELISSALHSLFDMYKVITGDYPSVHYCMGDADKAQYNAVMNVATHKRGDNDMVKYFMCFFHVIKNVAERVSSFPIEVVSVVFKHLYLMHYSRDPTEFAIQMAIALNARSAYPVLHSFSVYFKKQWIDSQFCNWVGYHTPAGFATTNNPVEQFNNAIKRDYSLRTLLKLVALVEQLTVICRHRSRGTFAFALESKPNRELKDRYKYLQSQGRLSVIQPHKHGLDFLLDGPSETHVAYVYQRGAPPRPPIPDEMNAKKKLGKRNKPRMETRDQPDGGWRVDMQRMVCPCFSWYKYRLCVHLVAALRATGRDVPGDKQVKKRFANRSRKRKGRVPEVGPALSFQ